MSKVTDQATPQATPKDKKEKLVIQVRKLDRIETTTIRTKVQG